MILGAVMMVQRSIYQGEVAGDDSGPLNVRCLADQSREVPEFAAEHGVNYLHFAAVEVLPVSNHTGTFLSYGRDHAPARDLSADWPVS